MNLLIVAAADIAWVIGNQSLTTPRQHSTEKPQLSSSHSTVAFIYLLSCICQLLGICICIRMYRYM